MYRGMDSMKYFKSPEANLFFSLAVLAENKIIKIEKKIDRNKITIDNYINFRKLLYDLGFSAKKTIEDNSNKYIGEKAYHQQTIKRVSGKGEQNE